MKENRVSCAEEGAGEWTSWREVPFSHPQGWNHPPLQSYFKSREVLVGVEVESRTLLGKNSQAVMRG